MNKANNAGLAVDGDFGAGTKQAVINFQKANGLTADGIAGPATINKLVEVIKNKNNPKPSIKATYKIWMSDSKMGNEVSSFEAGKWYYMCYKFYYEYSGKLLSEITSLKDYKITETIYNPDGSVFNTCTYENSDNNWIGIRPTITGTYKWELKMAFTESSNTGSKRGEFNVACNHSYGSWTTTKSATCTSDGSEKRICSICGQSETRTISKTGHSFGNWTTVKSATCTADGSEKKTCSMCGQSETRNISKTNHKYTTNIVAPTCTSKGYTLHICSICSNSYKDNETSATGHKLGDWTTAKSATCTADGSKTRTCSTCGAAETQTISKTGHNYTEKIVSSTFTEKGYTLHTCSVCGDSYKDNYTEMKIKGDINNDSSVGVSDVVFLQKYLVKSMNISSEQFLAADINSDGQVNVFDCVILKRRILMLD